VNSRPRWTFVVFSLPIGASLVIQNAMSMVSTAMVGRLGTEPLAGFAAANAVVSILLALLFGLSTAIQTLTARARGAGDPESAEAALTAGLRLSIGTSAVLTVVSIAASPFALSLIVQDPQVVAEGARFLVSFSPILVFLGVNMSFSAYWNGIGAPRLVLLINLAQLPIHVMLGYVLTFGAAGFVGLGVFGTGLASTVAAAAASVMHFSVARRTASLRGRFAVRPRRSDHAALLRIGLPVSLQQPLAHLGMAMQLAIVARIGVADVAAANAIQSLMLMPVLASTGVGVAAATSVGEALGRGDPEDASRWGWFAAVLGALLLAPISLALVAEPDRVLGGFIGDPVIVRLAAVPLQIVGLSISIDALGRILNFALRGAGATRFASAASLGLLVLFQLPLTWFFGLELGYGLPGVMAVVLAREIVEAAVMAALWKLGRWRATEPRPSGSCGPSGRWPTLPEWMPPAALDRIAVMGGAGAGKSVLARELALRLDLPPIHLDRLRYAPAWRPVDVHVFRSRLSEAIHGGYWIADGSYPEVADLTLPEANLIVWLEQPMWLRIWRSWWKARTHEGHPRTDRPEGCRESFGWRYLREIVGFGRLTPALRDAIRAVAPGSTVLLLRGDRDLARFLEVIASPRVPSTFSSSPPSAPGTPGSSRSPRAVRR
jgi:multidrug resistance protein, MATE family